jgi:hypothetical protein
VLGTSIIRVSRDHIVTSRYVAAHVAMAIINYAERTLEAGENTAEEFIHVREPFGKVTNST